MIICYHLNSKSVTLSELHFATTSFYSLANFEDLFKPKLIEQKSCFLIFNFNFVFVYIATNIYTSLMAYVNAAPEVVEKPTDSSLSRLRTLYFQAKDVSEAEMKYVYPF